MDAVHLTHLQLAKVEPGSLVLVGATDAEAEQYFAIAVHRAGEPARRVWCPSAAIAARCGPYAPIFRPQNRRALRADLGRFSVEPNLLEPIRTDLREQSALAAGDLLVHDGQQFLVIESAKDSPPLVVDLAGGEVSELSAESVAVVTHWNICIHDADGQRTCLVDTKSHKSTTAPAPASFPLQLAG